VGAHRQEGPAQQDGTPQPGGGKHGEGRAPLSNGNVLSTSFGSLLVGASALVSRPPLPPLSRCDCCVSAVCFDQVLTRCIKMESKARCFASVSASPCRECAGCAAAGGGGGGGGVPAAHQHAPHSEGRGTGELTHSLTAFLRSASTDALADRMKAFVLPITALFV
jgi:hypothetical protein